MAPSTKTPLALYKANLELVLRLGTLLQENRRRWNQLGTSGASAAIERTLAETERMLTSNDWASLAAMPGEEFWKSVRDDAGPLQGSTQAALANQVAFADGLREAFAAWQQQSLDALGEDGLPAGPFSLGGLLSLSANAQSAPAKPSSRGRKPKPRAAKAAAGKKGTLDKSSAKGGKSSPARPSAGGRMAAVGTARPADRRR